MLKLFIFVSTALTWNAIQAANITENADQNKTKRGLVGQTRYYGEPVAVKYIQTPVYYDSASSAATQPGISSSYYSHSPRPVLFHNPSIKAGSENEPPKQVTVQQVLYEYQQTPHNAVSNVHVNQQFQTAPVTVSEQRQYVPDPIHSQTSYPSTPINPHFVNQPHILQVEPNQFSGVAAPVQHGAIIHHGQGQGQGQGYSKIFYNPYPVVQTTNAPAVQNNAQPKYVYVNGKILYHPAQTNVHANNPYPGVIVPARAHNLVTNLGYQQRPAVTQRPFKPSPLIPITYGTQQAHPKAPIKPTEAPVKEEVEEEETDDKSDVREEQDEESDDDHSNYEAEQEEEEEDDYKPSYYSKYRYDDDDDDHEHYREHEDEEEEDNTRSHSRQVRKKPNKNNRSENKPGNRYHKNDHYKFSHGYDNNKKYTTQYKSPRDYFKAESSNKKPKAHYKSYKYYKSHNNAKPRKETIEGHQSQNIPIIHNKKIIHQEKWLISKKESSE